MKKVSVLASVCFLLSVSAFGLGVPLIGKPTIWSGVTYLGVGGSKTDDYIFATFFDGTLRAATVNASNGALTQVASTSLPHARRPEVFKGSDGYYLFVNQYPTAIVEFRFAANTFIRTGSTPYPAGDTYTDYHVAGLNGSPILFARRQNTGNFDVIVANAVVETIPKATLDLSSAGFEVTIVGATAYLYRPVAPIGSGQPRLQTDTFSLGCLSAPPCAPPFPLSTYAHSYSANSNNVFSFWIGRAHPTLYNATIGGVSSVDISTNPANPPAPHVFQLVFETGGPIGSKSDACWQGGSGMAAAELPDGSGRIVTNWSGCGPAYSLEVVKRSSNGSLTFGQQGNPSNKNAPQSSSLAVFSTGTKYFAYSIGSNATAQLFVTECTNLTGIP